MVTAYILINTKPGKESEILDRIKQLCRGILESSVVYGEYDIVLKVSVENIEDLRNLVIDNLRKIEGIERTTTLISAEL